MKLIRKPVIPNTVESIEQNILFKFRSIEKVEHETWKKYIKY